MTYFLSLPTKSITPGRCNRTSATLKRSMTCSVLRSTGGTTQTCSRSLISTAKAWVSACAVSRRNYRCRVQGDRGTDDRRP